MGSSMKSEVNKCLEQDQSQDHDNLPYVEIMMSETDTCLGTRRMESTIFPRSASASPTTLGRESQEPRSRSRSRCLYHLLRALTFFTVVSSITLSGVFIAHHAQRVIAKTRIRDDNDGIMLLRGFFTILDILFLISIFSSHVPSIYKMKITRIFLLPFLIFDTVLVSYKLNFEVLILMFTSGLESHLKPICPSVTVDIPLVSVARDLIQSRGIQLKRLKKEKDMLRRFVLFKKMLIISFGIEFGGLFYGIYENACTEDTQPWNYRLLLLLPAFGMFLVLLVFGIYSVWTENYRCATAQFWMMLVSMYNVLLFRYKTDCWNICWVLIPIISHSISVYFYGWLLYRRAGIQDIKPNFLGAFTLFLQSVNILVYSALSIAGTASLMKTGMVRTCIAGITALFPLICFLLLFWATWTENADRIQRTRTLALFLTFVFLPIVLLGVVGAAPSIDSFLWYLIASVVAMHLPVPTLLCTAYYNYELVKFTMQTELNVWEKYFCCMKGIKFIEKIVSWLEGIYSLFYSLFEWIASKCGLINEEIE